MVKHEALVGKMVQKNLNKASQFEAKANKLTEKASDTSTYPVSQVNKFTEKAASEELKAEQYRAGALLTAQESSLPGGVMTAGGVAMQQTTMGKGSQGPPPPMLRSGGNTASNSNSNTAMSNSNVKENVMLAGRPLPLASSTSTVATTPAAIPIAPLTGGSGSAPGLGASQAGRSQGTDAAYKQQQQQPVSPLATMQSSKGKAPLPNILMDGNNENKQAAAAIMQTSLKVIIHPPSPNLFI